MVIHILPDSAGQRLLGNCQGKHVKLKFTVRQFCQQAANNAFILHDPAENDVFVFGTGEKIVEQMDNVVLHHLLSFVGHHKRIHHPAPVAVQKNAVIQHFQKFAGRGRLS